MPIKTQQRPEGSSQVRVVDATTEERGQGTAVVNSPGGQCNELVHLPFPPHQNRDLLLSPRTERVSKYEVRVAIPTSATLGFKKY